LSDITCSDCQLWRTASSSNGLYSCNCLKGDGAKPSKLMFVSVYPGDSEVQAKKPFVGLEGQLVRKYLKLVGTEEAYFTYLLKCKPPFGFTPTAKEVQACSKYLIEEIKEVQPKVIVLLGSGIFSFFKIDGKITQLRGIPIYNEEYKCHLIPAYHPAYINNFLEVSPQRKDFAKDLALAYQISQEGITKPLESNYIYCDTLEKAEAAVNDLLSKEWCSFDTETDGLDYFRSKILMASFSNKIGTGYVIPYLHPKGFTKKEDQEKIKELLQKILGSSVKKIMQFGKFDLQMCFTAGFDVQNFAFDTYVAHALLDENSGHGLEKVVPVYTDMGNYKDEVSEYISGDVKILREGVSQVSKYSYLDVDGKKITMTQAYRKSNIFDCPYDKLVHYAAQDADATYRLFIKFWDLLEKEDLLKLLLKSMVPLSYVLAKIEYEGVGGDIGYAKRMSKEFNDRLDAAEADVLLSKEVEAFMQKYKVPNNRFNCGSSDQLAKLLFIEMGLKPVAYNKITPLMKQQGIKQGSPKTDTPSLKKLLTDNKIKLLEDLIRIGEIAKPAEYMGQYVELLTNSPDGRIHTRYNQVKSEQGGTVTGRLSSSQPNLQNIPSHDPGKAKLVKTVFVAKPGYTFIEADYKVIEFRCWAHDSNDIQMLTFLNDPNTDIHKKVASQVYKISEDKVTKTMRDLSKQTVYGMMYGRGSWSIAKQYGMTEDEVNRFMNGFFRMFPTATTYLEKNIALMHKQGYITNLFGRRRRALNIYSKDKELRAQAERQARNSPLQSAAADLIYIAMIKLTKALLPYDAKVVMQIHDSLVVEIKDEILDEVISVTVDVMENAVKLKCATPVDVEVGKCLGDMIGLKEYKENQGIQRECKERVTNV
jgi:DNA polymerase-1